MIGCSAACGEVAFPQRTFWQGASQVSGSVDGVGSSRRSFVRRIDSAVTPSLSPAIDPPPQIPPHPPPHPNPYKAQGTLGNWSPGVIVLCPQTKE